MAGFLERRLRLGCGVGKALPGFVELLRRLLCRPLDLVEALPMPLGLRVDRRLRHPPPPGLGGAHPLADCFVAIERDLLVSDAAKNIWPDRRQRVDLDLRRFTAGRQTSRSERGAKRLIPLVAPPLLRLDKRRRQPLGDDLLQRQRDRATSARKPGNSSARSACSLRPMLIGI